MIKKKNLNLCLRLERNGTIEDNYDIDSEMLMSCVKILVFGKNNIGSYYGSTSS